ncbi:MAG: PD-(D/E)XK nuclease family protein [Muribaculaceae bacterium]|nr:PD-(D/E)XK nuclease family protein [Muribaculaceae bacterium]
MEPILKTVAEAYASRYGDLREICFLFPNKRCGVFLRKYLREAGVGKKNQPAISTVSDFMGEVAGLKEATRIQQLFVLYNSYLDILGKERDTDSKIEFDEFRGWGETVISDFNTIDFAMVDPDIIFKNVSDYRKLSTNFFREEQKEVMREYFGVEDYGDSEDFWRSFEDVENLSTLKQSFLRLWQVLSPLYHKFQSALFSEKLATSGLIYRKAAEILQKEGSGKLKYKKIVAVGFNALTETERVVFKTLQEEEENPVYGEFIDFIWDATGPVLTDSEFSASRFVEYNKKHFPIPEWISEALKVKEMKKWPDIRVISSPSNTAQAKIAGELLEEYKNEEDQKCIEEAEVAVVLPDEELFSNILYSIPDDLGAINLTMGYSLRHSPTLTFIYLLRRLYNTMRESRGNNYLYVKDLKMFLSHPFSYMLIGAEGKEKVMEYIQRFHKVTVSYNEIKELAGERADFLSFPAKNVEPEELFGYLKKIIELLRENFKEKGEEQHLQEIEELRIYQECLDDLERNIEKYNIKMAPLSIIYLADRLIAAEKIGFEGEPLIGLQVMGMLETRSLDFRHVIIMSMNEGIMPRKSFVSTFLPETLRRGYGLPPARYAEEIFAYYFYRLISRAEKVTLIYDGRATTGMRGGMSRYLLQILEYAPKESIIKESWKYGLKAPKEIDSSIEKTEQVKELAQVFITEGESRKNLSASSLNNYRECQVKFFLQNLLGIKSDPEKSDFMDAITVGQVLHESMMELYIPEKKLQRKLIASPLIINGEYIEGLLSNKDIITKVVRKKINKYYYGDEEIGSEDTKSGVTDLISEQISTLVEEILAYDLQQTPFELFGCEIEKNIRIQLQSGRVVNFRFAIDRLDRINIEGKKFLRIVDYKTGTRKRNAKSLEEMFKGGFGSEQIFQLFVYAWLLGKMGIDGWEDVITEIYYVPDMKKGERGLPKINDEVVECFRPYIAEFSDRLENLIEDIFVSDTFKQTLDKGLCSMCVFKSYCRK